MHASYYYRAQACIMVFDVTRKITYKNLENWYQELQQHAKGIPTLVVANKIDIDYQVSIELVGRVPISVQQLRLTTSSICLGHVAQDSAQAHASSADATGWLVCPTCSCGWWI
eukprot:GHUV01022065.1.p1 GENE.GHUV01022065.1~~GHUV01022065.1.p1  ORF type:complete len:113 (-),score=33.11 GHUV01022065.1:1145-1483(-)